MSFIQRFASSSRLRSGFTLIELLVVMAVIGVLVSILLPAIMQAREAANRSQCQNNLKQLGIALHNYHDVHATFPVGARAQRGIGPSWMVGILPYLDQGALFQQFDMDSPNNGWPAGPPPPIGSRNGTLLNGKTIPGYWCPSSGLPQYATSGTSSFQLSSYVGIAGATNEDGFPAKRVTTCCITGGNNGQISADGVLIPNSSVRIGDLTDGASNVLLVAEASDYSLDSTGARKRTDGAFNNSWATGTSATGTPPSYLGSSAAAPPPPSYNITTIRYVPNCGYSKAGIFDNHGPNNPINSAHRGGLNILLGDGVVKFISENLFINTLKGLAVRDDASPLGEF
jgi:prepilin-type N-terminal cleavage/methylation domain-containing protein